MSEQPAPSQPKTKVETKPKAVAPAQKPAADGKARNWLIFGLLGLAASIIFGLLYLFVLAPTVPGGSVGWFLFSFATGLTMIVMPCTLPLAFVIVPLSMGKGIVRGLGMALAFGVGVAVMLSTYGIIAALLGGFALEFLGNDIEPIKNWVYFIAGSFALVFALSEIGLMNIHMPTYSGAAPAFVQKRGELIKAFLLGLFLGNVGVGCPHPATPLILIEIASSGDILYGWLMFLVHAIGRVLPLLLLAFMAILGVNGLNWLMQHKAAVERVTGWGMVFVAGFILTLGLFTHDWWVNSGIHNALEAITQESFFNSWFNNALGQNVAHVHGIEEGVGLFGQPLWWGHYFLVLTWLIPVWWYYRKKRRKLFEHPSFKLKELEKEVDRLEEERSRIEETANIDGLDTATDLKGLKAQIATLKKQRRDAAERVGYGETGNLRNPLARDYEVKILGMQRNYFIGLSIVLALVFIYFMPNLFYYKSMSGEGHGDDHHGAAAVDTTGLHMMNGMVMNAAGEVLEGAHMMPDGSFMLADGTTVGMGGMMMGPAGETFDMSTRGLPEAESGLQFVDLDDGDTYDIVAEYVQKEVGNRTLRMMAYNRTVPGPFIRAQQGAEVTINFTNRTDIDQTIHSHGLRLDNNSDGVPGVTQDVVKPGESYSYTLAFPDAGVFWYHPHTRDDYGQEMGLYGNYLVAPAEADYWNDVNRTAPLVIDDILINNDKVADFYKDFTNYALLGRFGNTFLVNGQEDYTTTVSEGEVVRYYVTNVSNARTYNISIPGAQIKKVGADLGRFEQEEYVDTFLISPAERVVIEVYFPRSGTYKLMQNTPTESFELARFVTDGEVDESYVETFNQIRANTDVLEEFADFRSYLSQAPDKEVLLTIDLSGMMVDHSAHEHMGGGDDGHDHGSMSGGVDHSQHTHSADSNDPLATIQWNDDTQSDIRNKTPEISWQMVDVATGRVSMDIPVEDWTFTEGDLVKIRFTNDADADHVMQHPIHFHGQQFVVLARDGVVNDNMAWKDTALVFPGETVDLLVDMSNLGEWMSHCHISEHLHTGMMMQFRVEDENGYATGDEYRATVEPGMGHTMPSTDTNTSPAAQSNTTVDDYSFNMELEPSPYFIAAEPRTMQVGKKNQFTVAIFDDKDVSLMMSQTEPNPITVTFVRSDNASKVYTFPGNTAFDTLEALPAAPMPAGDGHNHMHFFELVPKAYASPGAHGVSQFQYTYTMPVAFASEGTYRAFVTFIPDGETQSQTLSFDVSVAKSGFNVDNFGWSDSMQWWILLIGSLILMAPLVWGVRRYVLVAEAPVSKPEVKTDNE